MFTNSVSTKKEIDQFCAKLELNLKGLESQEKARQKEIRNLKVAIKDFKNTSSSMEENTIENDQLPLVNISTIDSNQSSPKNLKESVLEYLNEVNTPCSAREVANGLREKGVKSQSKNFQDVIKTVLYQLEKKHKKIIKVEPGKWQLLIYLV